eukprot:120429-Amphidinium_carterae.1
MSGETVPAHAADVGLALCGRGWQEPLDAWIHEQPGVRTCLETASDPSCPSAEKAQYCRAAIHAALDPSIMDADRTICLCTHSRQESQLSRCCHNPRSLSQYLRCGASEVRAQDNATRKCVHSELSFTSAQQSVVTSAGTSVTSCVFAPQLKATSCSMQYCASLWSVTLRLIFVHKRSWYKSAGVDSHAWSELDPEIKVGDFARSALPESPIAESTCTPCCSNTARNFGHSLLQLTWNMVFSECSAKPADG